MKKVVTCLLAIISLTSCSVQQFAVNTEIEPFEKGGRVWGEKVEKCGKNAYKSEFRKGGDIHLLGINVKQSNVKVMVDELEASSYTIEVKSNLILHLLTFGILEYKVVKVIKRDK